MATRSLLLWLYLLNASVLLTHEIDAAYWREWELLRIPGGIQVGGLLAVGIHMVLLVQGDVNFRVPVSLALLATTGVLSVAQAAALIRGRLWPAWRTRR